MQAKDQPREDKPLPDVRSDQKLEWRTPELTVIEITETDSGFDPIQIEDTLNMS